jgi:hypothetical protein
MTIARNPRRTPKTARDKKAEKFIRGKNGTPPPRELKAVPVNFDVGLLERIDLAARDLGLNRSAFIVSAAGEKLRSLLG